MIPDTLPSWAVEPIAWAVVSVVAWAVLRWQRTLSYHEYTAIHRLKRRVLPVIDRLQRPLVRVARRQSPALGVGLRYIIPHLIHDKDDRGGDEYVATWEVSRRELWDAVIGEGWSPHVLASLKRRSFAAEHQYSDIHAVYQHDDGTQTEIYTFTNPDGTQDVYAHHETSVVDAKGHLNDEQTGGDPRDVVPHPFAPGYTDNSGEGDGEE